MTAERSRNEPMLPRDQDDAPMISSVQTRIIADARGAYLAGNLRALTAKMDADQQMRFRQALMRQGIAIAESLFRYEDGMPEVPALEALRQWAEHGTPYEPPDTYDILASDPEAIYAAPHTYLSLQAQVTLMLPRVIVEPDLVEAAAWALSAIDLRRMSMHRTQGPREDALIERLTLAKQWQIDAAWAIVQRRDPPDAEPSG
jgi:hypothetical protein